MTKSVNQEPILVPIPKKYLPENYYFEPINNNLIYYAKNKKIDSNVINKIKITLSNLGITAKATSKIGRNETCPCGSGKKFKRCHGSDT